MPVTIFALMLTTVILAAGATVWLLSTGGPTLWMIAAPAFLLATALLARYRK